ncbi:hypothetical protein SpCBS45565_g02883 [Spizellomyces sp. 'palustris']|nr:hypothetical protein SpCBS45565_g02883 [Spizellomyces sp. 'palustris']
MSTATLVVDNGAYTIKCGFAERPETLRLSRNCIAKAKGDRRTFIGDQLVDCRDYSGLFIRIPFEKGYLTNWEIQKTIWERLFSSDVLDVKASETNLLLTEPCFNLPNIQRNYDEIIFEEFGFAAYHRTAAANLCKYTLTTNEVAEGMLIVDSGYSFTHIVPIYAGRPIREAMKRIDVGGKLLTNQLKETISFRQWNMMDETYLVNGIKELCCYVSQQFEYELKVCKSAKSSVKLEYVLPDLAANAHGYVRPKDGPPVGPDQQVLIMNNERFTVPEVLFSPSDIGIQQAGLAEAIVEAVQNTDPNLHGLFFNNVFLAGGNICVPGLKNRLESDLRKLVPVEADVRVIQAERPITAAWEGGVKWIQQYPNDFNQKCVTRAEFMEYGSTLCEERFA